MEEKIWSKPNVFPLLSEKYVVVSLYVDDNDKMLPQSMIYHSPANGELRKSFGAKWSDFQAICFNTNTQPQYALIAPDGPLLRSTWQGYDDNPKKFEDFLVCGLDAFRKHQSK